MAEEINPDADINLSDVELLDTSDAESPESPVKEKDTEEEIPEESEETDDEDSEEEAEEEIPETRTRPSLKTITEKAPEAKELFKKFPQLRDAYYREGQFSQLFPTIDDAKEAAEKAVALDVFNDAVMSGSSKEILEAVKGADPENYKKFVASILPTLSTMDREMFYEVSVPIVDRIIVNLFKTGERTGGKDGQNMVAAARIINHYMHDTYDIQESKPRVDPEIEKERKKLADEKNQFTTQVERDFENSINSQTNRSLNKLISDGLDPENSLPEFTKNKIIEEVIERVGAELSKDRQHMSKMGKLWQAAKQGRFSAETADRIRLAFLSRAKQLIPEIRTKVKKEATGVTRKTNNGISRTTRRDSSAGNAPRSSNGKAPTKPSEVNWRKTSDMDLLK